jgi:hypothetical protein
VSRADDFMIVALKTLKRPSNDSSQSAKKRHTELMSNAIAPALAAELIARGLKEARPTGDNEDGGRQGAERRLSGAIGAKKVDVSWATEESGLLLAISVKCIMWPDAKTGNFQKNMTNRREGLLFESVTLHRRFPYSVLGGFMLFHKDAEHDGTAKRSCTFINAHRALKLFTGRSDPAGRDEQYERLFIGLVDDNPVAPSIRYYEAGKPDTPVSLDKCLDDLLRMVVDRDPDLWALLGPNDEKEPGDLSPLSIAGFGRGGTLLKRSPKGKKKGAKAAPPAPATQLQLEEDGDPDVAADENDDADVEDGDDEEDPDDVG